MAPKLGELGSGDMGPLETTGTRRLLNPSFNLSDTMTGRAVGNDSKECARSNPDEADTVDRGVLS